MRPALCLLALVLALVLALDSLPASAMEVNPDKPFGIPRERIAAGVHHIAVMPVSIPAEVPNRLQVAQRLEAAIEAQLRAGGFEPVPAAVTRAIRDDLADALGGLYDTATGKPVEAQQKALADYVKTQFESKHQVEAWLHPSVVVRKVAASGGKASWDGVVEPSVVALNQTVPKSSDTNGALSGLSLLIDLQDNNGKTLYARYGALQMTRLFYSNGSSVRQVAVDPAHLMEDPGRDGRALMIALQPLASGVETPAPAKLPPVTPVPMVANLDALKMPRSELLSGYPRLAFLPFSSADASLRPDSVVRYREMLEAKLKTAGFEIVDAADAGAALDRLRKSAPGFFDPLTGEFDEARWNAARLAILKEQGQRLGVQAVVDPGIVAVPAALSLDVRIIDVAGRALFEEQAELPGKPEADARVVDLVLREIVTLPESGKKR